MRSGEKRSLWDRSTDRSNQGMSRAKEAGARAVGGTKKLESYPIFPELWSDPEKMQMFHKERSSFAVLKVFFPIFFPRFSFFCAHIAFLCILLLHKLPSLDCRSLRPTTIFQTFFSFSPFLFERQLAKLELDWRLARKTGYYVHKSGCYCIFSYCSIHAKKRYRLIMKKYVPILVGPRFVWFSRHSE